MCYEIREVFQTSGSEKNTAWTGIKSRQSNCRLLRQSSSDEGSFWPAERLCLVRSGIAKVFSFIIVISSPLVFIWRKPCSSVDEHTSRTSCNLLTDAKNFKPFRTSEELLVATSK